MLTRLCQYLHNWFCDDEDVHTGEFTVEGGGLSAPFLKTDQYYRIQGSVFNDGVHKYGDPTDTLEDETFTGAIWAMRIPKDVLDLNDEIDAWVQNFGAVSQSPFSSENYFGDYSYTKATASGTGPDKTTWQGAFAASLAPWRKMR